MSPKKLFIVAGIITTVIILPYACKTQKKATLDCTTVEATYSKDIHPLVMANCMPCHKPGSKHGDFTTYEGISAVVKSGDLEIHALKKMDMPPSDVPAGNKPGPLSEEDRKKIRCWLNNGALNN
ncbi:MAG TPA: cytochrome c [Bacteroidia bacterium]|nr:cytochrome c [Bacteroidia bacterium]